MKKIIVLIDVNNCKFLIVKENNCWKLPVLDNMENIEDVKRGIFDKYRININNKIDIIEEEDNHILIRCFAKSELNNENYSTDIINNIFLLISDEQQKNILFKLSEKIFIEIINDSFWLGIILSIEDKIDNYEMKFILTDFLLFFSSIFCAETINYKFGEIKDKSNNPATEIKKLRKTYLKECPLFNSKNIKNIIDSMGINFDSYVFDIVVFLLDGDIIDINSRTWNKRDQEFFKLYNSIVMSPRNWIKNFFPQLYESNEAFRKPYVDELIPLFKDVKVEQKSYSTYKLFDKEMSYDERIYILQRIGLLKTIMMISNKFKKCSFMSATEPQNDIFAFNKFLSKAKATVIELLWNDKKNNNILFLENIFKELPKEINEKFYVINRKCRDNIHYGFYNVLSDDEYEILNRSQDIYLNFIIKEFQKKIKYKFRLSYKIALSLAKLQYWASK